jgi:thioredoxin-like negative regulator of GroEL
MNGFLTAGLALAVVSGAFGQAGHGTGRLTGVVLDDDGSPIAAAKVVITLLEYEVLSGRTFLTPKVKMRDRAVLETKTDKKGRWYFNGLSSGKWGIRASKVGYVAMSSVRDILPSPVNRQVKLWLEKMKEGFYSADPAGLEQANKLFGQGEFDKARGLYTAYLAKDPGAVLVMIIIGDCWRRTGDLSKAVEAYQAVVALTSQDPFRKDALGVALAKIGECHLDEGDRERGLDFLRRSVEVSPGNDTVRAELGDVLFSLGRTDEAVRHFLAAVEISPKRALLHYRLGLVYLNMDDREHARACFQKVIDLSSDTDLARQSRRFLAELGRRRPPAL